MATRLFSVVIDAADPVTLARWWSQSLGWPVTFEAADEVVVEPAGNDEDPAVPSLVFVPVDEAKRGKNRVHLDMASDSVEDQRRIVAELLARGASPADVGQGEVPWVVLADPEGNEFCVLEGRDRHRGRGPLAAIVVDAADPAGLARFWAAASGWVEADQGDGGVSLHNPRGLLPDLDLVPVTEPRPGKNRVHLDVAPFEHHDQQADVDRLLALGASHAWIGQADDVTWVVLADPEGNEFCVLRPR